MYVFFLPILYIQCTCICAACNTLYLIQIFVAHLPQLDLYDVLSQQPTGTYSAVADNPYRELLGKAVCLFDIQCFTMEVHVHVYVYTLQYYTTTIYTCMSAFSTCMAHCVMCKCIVTFFTYLAS